LHKNKIVTPINIFALFFLLALPSSCPISWFQARPLFPLLYFHKIRLKGVRLAPFPPFLLFWCGILSFINSRPFINFQNKDGGVFLINKI